MRRLLIAAALLLASMARGDVYTWGKFPVAKGYAGPAVVDVTWSSGAARPVAGITGTLIVYSSSPAAGVGGKVLFLKALTPAGDPSPTNEMVAFLTTTDTATPGAFYSELVLVEGSVTDVMHGTVVIEGR